MTTQLRWGWIGSIGFHLLLLMLALLLRLPEIARPADFIDVAWMKISSASPPAAPSTPVVKTPTTPTATGPIRTTRPTATPRRTINLPERRGEDLADDPLSISRRIEKTDHDIAEDPRTPSVDRPLQRIESATTPGGAMIGIGMGRAGAGIPGSRVGSGVGGPGLTGSGAGIGYEVQWSGDGGIRKKLSGELPKYPEGTNIAAQVRIETIVLPDGTVRAVKPIQKANTALEEAAMKALKLWRFEPLSALTQQVEQTCVVTFLFKLR